MADRDCRQFIIDNIRTNLSDAVEKRLMSDRPIGSLLSGGVDSSIVAALLANTIKNQVVTLKHLVLVLKIQLI